MPLHAGQEVELAIEKPAAGGRMIGRHEGQIVLVQGAIPGERVIARILRVEKQLAFAETTVVIQPSPDREATGLDLSCGGCLYAHVAYPRQLVLKGEVIRDAFERLGRIPIAAPAVSPSPVRAYRMRARLHVRGERAGFYREGTHELCDAAATGQLSDAAIGSASRAVEALVRSGCQVAAVELSENIAGDERVLQVDAAGPELPAEALDAALAAGQLTGCTGRSANGVVRTAGVPFVSDPLRLLSDGRVVEGALQRHAESFFQANRFLLPRLVTTVLDAVPAAGTVLDLYAGVGLFSVTLCASGREGITAVEGDRSSGQDLRRNAALCGAALRVCIERVEDHLKQRKRGVATIIVDPPRTGMSREAMTAVAAARPDRIIYVSCDPPTMARDARRLLDGGYLLATLQAFDLFPNTPHVESVGVFVRQAPTTS